ncbi:MAG: hypothetical protein J6V00_07800 [Bacteroidaceae bacterium]|nr:hypothetical protein [Bacteroidaceae bacterium]
MTLSDSTSNLPIDYSNPLVRHLKAEELYHHTARQYHAPRDYRNPTKREEQLNKEAVYMLTIIAALDYFIYDLIDEITEAGKYRQLAKRNINRANDIIRNAHDNFYRRLMRVDIQDGCKQYNHAMEVVYKVVNDCVALEAPERAYNIIVAMCRIQSEQCDKLGERYYFAPAKDIAKIPSMLDCLGITDYHLDNIIYQRIRKINFK